MRFTRTRAGGVKADVAEIEAAVLGQCAREVLQLVEEPDLGDDPLAALTGLGGDVERPHDPVLVRLLPDAYADDAEAASDFRRYTDAELRLGKRRHAQVVLDTLPDGGGKLRLDRDQCDAWLGLLNDVRLALGTGLGVSEDDEELDPEAPEAQAREVYDWLGWLQESLLSCLEPRLP